METYVLKAEPREVSGKQVRRLRRDGHIPAILYGHGIKPQNLMVARGDLEKTFRKAGGSSVVTVQLPKGEQNVLIHEVQQDPRTGQLLHADLFQVRMDEKIKATVPLVIEGTSPAVREQGGVLLTNVSEIEVECLPKDLPHEIPVNIDSLENFDDSITVADLAMPQGVTVLSEPDANVAAVQPPKTEEELEAELAEDTTPVTADDVEVEGEGEEGEAAEGEAAEGEGEAGAAEGGKDEAKAESKEEGKAEAKGEGGKEGK